MTGFPSIRLAKIEDASQLVGIYAPFVEQTAVSFETEVPTVEEFAARITKVSSKWRWLVAEADGRCLGYAYGSMHREREAYRWSTEVTIYMAEGYRGRGLGSHLYEKLLEELAGLGYCNAYAGVALPNDASLGLHRRLGFEAIGVFKSVGRKFECWHDVAWFQRRLRDAPPTE